MKKKLLLELFVWVVMISMAVGGIIAGYDYVEPPISAEDIIDALMPVPAATAKRFGNTEKTRLVFNITKLLEACRGFEARIKALESAKNAYASDIVELKKPKVADPNDPNEVAK